MSGNVNIFQIFQISNQISPVFQPLIVKGKLVRNDMFWQKNLIECNIYKRFSAFR